MYLTFYSQLLRLFNANNCMDNFIRDIKSLMNKLVNQNFVRSQLNHRLHEFSNNYYYEMTSFHWENINLNKLLD